ncbi:UNVERIFIED_CONTAM: Mitogen-activated protein kinase [Sesamum calycinum]|uniref:Mitogen-activated protein kinase n=1 Tax=Sesamum calycinum TaxID=2727403 RepID=A0AAW2SWC4_9LAMI
MLGKLAEAYQEVSTDEMNMPFKDFFTEYGEANLYEIQEVVGKGSYGVVAAAVDTHTGEKVAIKKISANVFHRDLKPKNILANADCKLKICDFGLARASFGDAHLLFFGLYDYVATRWYRAPELCGSFFSKYTPAIDIWSIGCIFAEMLTGKPLFPGKNVVHQLDLITDLLGSPSAEAISRIRNEKARRYLSSMKKKPPVPLSQRFPNIDPLALRLLERLIAFDPKDRPSAEEALADPYFYGLANVEDEPSTQHISKFEFEFERRKLTKDDVRELIYREQTDLGVSSPDAPGVPPWRGPDSLYSALLIKPYGVSVELTNLSNNFSVWRDSRVKQTSLHCEGAMPPCPGERVCGLIDEDHDQNSDSTNQTVAVIPRPCLVSPKKSLDVKASEISNTGTKTKRNDCRQSSCSARCLLRSDSISASKCIGVEGAEYCEKTKKFRRRTGECLERDSGGARDAVAVAQPENPNHLWVLIAALSDAVILFMAVTTLAVHVCSMLRKLLHHFPRTYVDLQNAEMEIDDGQYLIFVGKIMSSRALKTLPVELDPLPKDVTRDLCLPSLSDAAFMVPTELLAFQHYEHLLGLLEKIEEANEKPSVALLTGSTPSKQAQLIRKGLQTGDISMVIGTHTLIAEKVEFSALRIAVVDEQHRFGVVQRGRFNSKKVLETSHDLEKFPDLKAELSMRQPLCPLGD